MIDTDTVVSTIASSVPNWMKLDNVAQSLVLWFGLDWLVANITQMEKIWVIGLNSLTHGLLHDLACFYQNDEGLRTAKKPQQTITANDSPPVFVPSF